MLKLKFDGKVITEGNTTLLEMAIMCKGKPQVIVLLLLTKQKDKIYPYLVEENGLLTFQRFKLQVERFLDLLRFGKPCLAPAL